MNLNDLSCKQGIKNILQTFSDKDVININLKWFVLFE